MPEIKATDLAWAAGLVDGEGCVFIGRRKPRSPTRNASYYLGLKVAMGHKPTVVHFQSLFDTGSFHNVWNPSPGKRANPAYTFLATASQAITIIRLIRPYLVTKSEEADLAEEFVAIPVTPFSDKNSVESEIDRKRFDVWDRMRKAKPTFRFKEAHKEITNG